MALRRETLYGLSENNDRSEEEPARIFVEILMALRGVETLLQDQTKAIRRLNQSVKTGLSVDEKEDEERFNNMEKEFVGKAPRQIVTEQLNLDSDDALDYWKKLREVQIRQLQSSNMSKNLIMSLRRGLGRGDENEPWNDEHLYTTSKLEELGNAVSIKPCKNLALLFSKVKCKDGSREAIDDHLKRYLAALKTHGQNTRITIADYSMSSSSPSSSRYTSLIPLYHRDITGGLGEILYNLSTGVHSRFGPWVRIMRVSRAIHVSVFD
ncbi:hypothetical protein HYFRA_00006898 [Hymenoscyphus fraxineus]|uniref:Uncharacterized protein n=1 Tax=Hymenoscyphus fraxineus TaxID=746836 RepID=A0A9N9PNW0_9HELO|nr:hypothetical protein HYFRA_00006898 [Hymenoscyphus fraxineus]